MKKINICKSCLIIFLLVLDVTASSVEVLKETSNAFKTIAKDALPAVVFIDVEKTVEVESQATHPFLEMILFLTNFLEGDGDNLIKNLKREKGNSKGKDLDLLYLQTDTF